jgi:hypothetical protein
LQIGGIGNELETLGQGQAMRRRLVVTIVVTLFMVVTTNYMGRGSKEHPALPGAIPDLSRETRVTFIEFGEPSDPDEGTDLYGNRVQSAVATYGVDRSGALYDVHAPQVDLPHVDRPST